MAISIGVLRHLYAEYKTISLLSIYGPTFLNITKAGGAVTPTKNLNLHVALQFTDKKENKIQRDRVQSHI